MPQSPDRLRQAASEAQFWLHKLTAAKPDLDPTLLKDLAASIEDLVDAEDCVALDVMAAFEAGWKWADLAPLLGISPQAAGKKYGRS